MGYTKNKILKLLNAIRNKIIKARKERRCSESTSPWRAQVLVTKNVNHEERLAINYFQTINRLTLLVVYPLPNIDQFVSKVAQYSFYSTINLHNAYHQVPIFEGNKSFFSV